MFTTLVSNVGTETPHLHQRICHNFKGQFSEGIFFSAVTFFFLIRLKVYRRLYFWVFPISEPKEIENLFIFLMLFTKFEKLK